ncbi:MAG: aspartate kinase [Alphaproteobacteria bacterium]|uniref:aspartate kinase n=1 Tax=Brevundimonas sp. TaxID=1871086 RepID=UPI001831E9BA|nr:aspartate kinase [Brevundimonas sp.]MBU3971632.1 aspartate kinase [Alphaproteobacteria bacterium]MBA3049381.1 aspartate kinase [Brevundimonas sp.]MBU3973711.1 aspartate kinase [Alphaproteobacteria bacterium]MBU4038942.1 aspartate kinase [Alphaproteobacteria bacterium]MBU4135191.1 aspartate kinase [Alphaproteobacteria bacterium]
MTRPATTRLVMKFGGTSMGDLERIRRAARIVAAEAAAGKQVAVVVSAMAGKTNELVAWTDGAGRPAQGIEPSDDEYDIVVASGEQVTAGLLALTLRNMGLNARSWMGWQIPILTDEAHGRARIEDVPGEVLGAAMDKGEIAVVPGFQGVSRSGRITTLGRGGSDTSAVAVAAALDCPCDIYTDVDGVYTTDPRIESKARRLEKISYEEMLEMASLGAKVLQTRSVELAMAKRVPVRVLSSFIEPDENGVLPAKSGTLICDEEEIVEKRIVSGVTMSRDEARITLLGLSDRVEAPADVFTRLAEANVNVDMIVQSQARSEGAVNLTFTTGRRDAARAAELMRAAQAQLGFEELRVDEDVAKVSVVGVGMRSHAGVAQTMFRALADKGVKFQAISTSEIKISVLIDAAYAELAVRALHAAYGLDTV